ncbi:hypothetical protein [Streptomyces sp. NPDC048419]|uniref:hypothetical protein n=1 Tax=Streptomyces sp. NPDC048419 TaxID=3365547 RepID=UPI0037206164
MSLHRAFIGQIRRALATVTVAASVTGLSLVGGTPAHADAVVDCNRGDSLQTAIDDAIENAAGTTPTLTVTGFCEGTFTIKGDLNIQGSPGAVLDAGHAGPVITITGAKVQLSNLIIRNGANMGNGGGITVGAKGSLTLNTSRITRNAATKGGGIYSGGSLVVKNSQITGNTTPAEGEGGGVYDTGSLAVENSLITRNTAAFGGGIYNFGGEVTVSNSLIRRNTATVSGGGIENASVSGGTVTLTHSQVANNRASAGDGGGIDNNSSSQLTLDKSIVSRNTASDNGGGINNFAGDITLDMSLVTLNRARNGGGGINNSSGTVTLNTFSQVIYNIPDNCVNCS